MAVTSQQSTKAFPIFIAAIEAGSADLQKYQRKLFRLDTFSIDLNEPFIELCNPDSVQVLLTYSQACASKVS